METRPLLLIILHVCLDVYMLSLLALFWLRRDMTGIKEKFPNISLVAFTWIVLSINLRSFPSIFRPAVIPCYFSTIVSYGDLIIGGTCYFFRAWLVYYSTVVSKALEEGHGENHELSDWVKKKRPTVKMNFLAKLLAAGVFAAVVIIVALTRLPECRLDRYARLVTIVLALGIIGKLARLLGSFEDVNGIVRELKNLMKGFAIGGVFFLIATLLKGRSSAMDWFELNIIGIDQWFALAFLNGVIWAIQVPVLLTYKWERKAKEAAAKSGQSAGGVKTNNLLEGLDVDNMGLSEVLAHDATRAHLREYTKKALCAENVYFLEELNELKAIEPEAPPSTPTANPAAAAAAAAVTEGAASKGVVPVELQDNLPAMANAEETTPVVPFSEDGEDGAAAVKAPVIDEAMLVRAAEKCQDIYVRFIEEDSVFMININHKIRKKFLRRYNEGERRSNVYDSCKAAVIKMLATDVFPRYRESPAWDAMVKDVRGNKSV